MKNPKPHGVEPVLSQGQCEQGTLSGQRDWPSWAFRGPQNRPGVRASGGVLVGLLFPFLKF